MDLRFLDWRKKQEELANTYAALMATEYNIIEVSSPRQKANGTRIFQLPNGDKIGSFKSGYVRRCNDNSPHYQINKVYKQNIQHTINIEGRLKTLKYKNYTRELIVSDLSRMIYIVEFCKRNYNLKSLKHYYFIKVYSL